MDHGELGEGITGSRYVVTVDGDEYVAKNDGWGSHAVEGTHVLLQEWICACLGHALGVPMPEFSLLDRWGEICFGSRMLPLYAKTFADALLGRVANPEAIYAVAVFDAWVLNCDRHRSNLVVATDHGERLLVAIDHSHCPLHGAVSVEELEELKSVPAQAAIKEFIQRHLLVREHLAAMIHRVENLSDELICSLTTPPAGIRCSRHEHRQMVNYLIYRRDNLRLLFNVCRDRFPAIREYPL